MAYHVKTNGYAGLAKDGVSKYYVDVMCDTTADIPNPAEHPEWEIGSELVVLENGGTKYVLSNAREWVAVNFNSGGGGDGKEMLKEWIEKTIEHIESDAEFIANGVFSTSPPLSLKSAVFPKATRIGSGAFSSCSALTKLHIPLVTSISGGAFGSCTSLAYLDLPTVVNLESSAFGGCSALKP